MDESNDQPLYPSDVLGPGAAAQADRERAGFKQMAEKTAAMHKAFLVVGFTDEQAFDLTRDFFNALVNDVVEYDPDPDDGDPR